MFHPVDSSSGVLPPKIPSGARSGWGISLTLTPSQTRDLDDPERPLPGKSMLPSTQFESVPKKGREQVFQGLIVEFIGHIC